MGQQVLPPGFRFHPTDQELVVHYLMNKARSGKCEEGVIGEVDLYKLEPWDLPEKSVLHSRDPEWYFFNARDKKYLNGSRTNRATGAGFWKATGKDRKVTSAGGRMFGMKKTLVFYTGRAPNGERTDWIMHEYRLDEEIEKKLKNVSRFVLCRIHKKNGLGPRNGDQNGAGFLDEDDETVSPTADLIPEVADDKLPALCENEMLQECLDVSGPAPTGFLESSSHAPTDGDCEGIEGSSFGEELESILQLFASYESKDADGSFGPETHCVSNSLSDQGPGEIPMMPADHFTACAEGGCLNFITDTVSLVETAQLPPTETISEMPSPIDLGNYGFDFVHEFLHPAPNEAEILGELGDKVADGTDLIGDDYLEPFEMNHPLDGILLTPPLLEMDGTSRNFERVIGDKDTLQQAQAFDTEHGLSPSSEVPILTSGDIKDVSNVKLQCAVNLYRSHNGDGTFAAISSGFDLQLVPQYLEVQSTRPCIKSKDSSLSEPACVDAMQNCEQQQPQLLRAESFTVTELHADDEDLLASMESLSAGQPLNVLQGKATARMGVSSKVKLSSEDPPGSSKSSGQPIDSKIKGSASVPSSSQESPSSSAPSLPQIPKFLLKILHSLGNAPTLPASAAELSLGQRPVRFVDSDTLASEHVSRFGSKTSTAGFASGTSTCHCFKAEADDLRATPDGRFSVVTPTELTLRYSPSLLEDAKHLEGIPLIQCRCCLNTCSNNRIRNHKESVAQITPLTDHGEVWRKLFNGLTGSFFWGTTLVLIFFCLLRGFCRLTKSALTVF